jgi:hypothetical protein
MWPIFVAHFRGKFDSGVFCISWILNARLSCAYDEILLDRTWAHSLLVGLHLPSHKCAVH